MDKLQAMTTFVKIANHGSLSAAAQELDKSLPTVVRILAALEEALQVRLFNRTTRRIALTQEGILYLEQCRKILADIEDAERALIQEQSEPSGTITMTAPVRFGEMYVAPAVTAFLNRYPKTQVNLLLLDRVVDLLEEGIDVAIRIAHLGDSSLIAKPIGHIRQVVCASPALLAQTSEPKHPEELSSLPCVRFTGAFAGSAWHFHHEGKTLSVNIMGTLSCNQVGACVQACIAGLGYGRFLCYQVMPWIKSGELALILADFEPAPMPLSLVYPHARLLSSRVRVMVDWIANDISRALQASR
ncbi:MAG TPA: LysR family transcriptional regulator [Gammaproteobacteria bacterium]